MPTKLKPIEDQIFFLTGATTQLGEAIVQLATERGACVFMVAQDEEELGRLQEKFRINNSHTAYAVANLSEKDQLKVAVEKCLETFGRIDTWINNPDTFEANAAEEERDLFDSYFWSVVSGTHVAIDVMKDQEGVIINVGSLFSPGLSEALKAAVKNYTESLSKEMKSSSVRIYYISPSENSNITAKKILESVTSLQFRKVPAALTSSLATGMAGGFTFFFLKRLRLI